ncbi:hypothetical protein E4U41_007710 [Claviceps citrina]|nr:hypothetical protein E4U41_007710 [Claviceps citrina]
MLLNSVVKLLLGAISCVSASPLKVDKHFRTTSKGSGFDDGHFYSFWSDYKAVNFAKGPGGSYQVSWNKGGNFVAGTGWKHGDTKSITYSGTWNSTGNSYLSVYGWSKNPLVECYIVENYGSYNPSHGGHKRGEVTVDGSVYDIYVSKRTNAPSIAGRKTFPQYWSIRRNKRVGGTVSVSKHFDAWESLNMKLGTFDYFIVATEGYYSSGSASITVE